MIKNDRWARLAEGARERVDSQSPESFSHIDLQIILICAQMEMNVLLKAHMSQGVRIPRWAVGAVIKVVGGMGALGRALRWW